MDQKLIREQRVVEGFMFFKCFAVRRCKTGFNTNPGERMKVYIMSHIIKTQHRGRGKRRKSTPTSTKRRMLSALRREVCGKLC